MRASALLVLVVVGWGSIAHAQLSPTAQAWAAAETTLRAHYAATGRTLVELTPQRDRRLGTMFWARFSDGGGLVAVRGTDVIDAHGDASIAAILRADDALHAHRWAAADLLYLITTLGTPPPLARNAVTNVRALAPSIEYGRDAATLIVYAYRDGPPEDPAQRSYYVQRASGTLGADGTITWTVTDVVLDLRGHERFLPGHRPTVYDACRICASTGASCAECTSRACRSCHEHSLVLTDPTFCLPRCR